MRARHGWLGHSERIADAFYRQVTDSHFAKATEADCSALQKALHQPAISATNDNQQKRKTPGKHGISRVLAGVGMGVTGFEPVTSTV
jgi:hypothetical protein